MSGSRHDKLGRAHSTAEDAKRGRPLPAAGGPPLTLLLVGATQHAACASGVGEGGGEAGKFSRSHMRVACSWEVLVATRRAVTCSVQVEALAHYYLHVATRSLATSYT